MSQNPSPQDIAKWDRWFAIEMNNLAWTLGESPERTPAQQEEMLHAAHASALHWRRVGTELNQARADMLLGQVHALLGNGQLAMSFAQRSFEYVTTHDSPDWEIAFAHAVLANAACAARDMALHSQHYARATSLGKAIADVTDKEIFQRTFAQLPGPRNSNEPPPDAGGNAA